MMKITTPQSLRDSSPYTGEPSEEQSGGGIVTGEPYCKKGAVICLMSMYGIHI